MIKLVVSDIDGTLLPEGTDKINPEMYDVIRELQAKGITFVAASGRQYASIRYVFGPVADELYYISENGSNVMYHGKNISTEYMDPDLSEELIHYLLSLEGCGIILSTPEMLYVEKGQEELLKLMIEGYHDDVTAVDSLIPYCRHTNKVALYCGKGVDHLEKPIMERFSSRLNTARAGAIWIDFMKLGTDKGNALKELQKQLGITPEETMAFGDNCNDIGMLKCAGESYAVANAHPQLKEAAKYITYAHDEDGVIRTIREKLLQGD